MQIPTELAGAILLIDRFQVEGFLRLMQKQIHSTGKRGLFSKKLIGPQVRGKLTFEDMLCFQKDPIPTSLLKISCDQISQAIKLFQIILKYMGVDLSDRVDPSSLDERIELAGKLYKQTLKRAELRDELFAQISKQTRNNPDRKYLTRAWELMYLCASSMPPSKEIGAYLSEYVHSVTHGVSIDPEVQALASNTLHVLKRSIKVGPRHTTTACEEIEALLTGRKLTTIVFFLDEMFEEIAYDMATIVSDVVEELGGMIKLSAFSSFSLYELRKIVTGSKSSDPRNEEYVGLDDNKYIGDLLVEFKAAKDRSKGEILLCKLILKKKLFRESDEVVTDPMFVQLSYVQLAMDRKCIFYYLVMWRMYVNMIVMSVVSFFYLHYVLQWGYEKKSLGGSYIARGKSRMEVLDSLFRSSDTSCVWELRMWRNAFGRLCHILRERGDLVEDGDSAIIDNEMFVGGDEIDTIESVKPTNEWTALRDNLTQQMYNEFMERHEN